MEASSEQKAQVIITTNLIIQQINIVTTNKKITNRNNIINFTTKAITHIDWLHVGAATHKDN